MVKEVNLNSLEQRVLQADFQSKDLDRACIGVFSETQGAMQEKIFTLINHCLTAVHAHYLVLDQDLCSCINLDSEQNS